MDAHDIHQKDFLSSLFSPDHQHSADADPVQMFPYNPPSQPQQQSMSVSHSTPHPQLAMEMLGAMMQMQGLDSQATSPVLAPAFNPQTILEQQFKLTQLQQLQQLQNQIFQQQIALISSQTPGMAQTPASIEPRREQPQGQFNNGLPTPGPSAEIQAQPSIDYVSPMILNNNGAFQPPENYMSSHLSTTLPNYGVPRGSTSAPEHIAFRHPNFPSADLDFDISPLASPWLGAHHQPVPSSLSKRSASASGDEGVDQPSRKKHSPAIHPINVRKVARTSKSTNSTPLLRSTRSRNGSIAEEPVGDTPSPVDLSMPPPAPPTPVPTVQESSSSTMGGRSSPAFTPQFTPVTPASIMNLGRLGASHGASTNANGVSRPIAPLKGEAKAKAAAASKTKSTHEPPSRSKRKPAGGSTLVSPNLKAILPATTPTISFSANSTTNTFTPTSPTTPTQSLGPLRKTSHKAAEQKRRDSLKTTFDELRLLLPPLPLPTDAEEQSAIPILPGALPPRGPPKAGGEGPNKAVSKLQLLMCGNEYIKVLKGRVERRDEEIAKLRKEVKRMKIRMGMGMDMVGEGQGEDELDLEKDLDAVEAFGGPLAVKAFISSVSGSNGMVNGVAVGDDEADDDLGEG